MEEKQVEAKGQCLETPEILKLDAQVANAHDWLAEVTESLSGGEFPLRALEKLVRAGKSLPVNFGEPYDQACKRLQMSQDLQKRIQATYKSGITRKRVDGNGQQTQCVNMYQEQLNLAL